jgi:hypothetical protein
LIDVNHKKFAFPLKKEHEEMRGRGEGEIRLPKQDTGEDIAQGHSVKINAQS